MTADEKRNLYQRRIAARADVYKHEFSKVKTDGLKYPYISIDQIKPVAESAMIDHGIVMDIVGLDVEEMEPPTEKTNKYTGDPSIWFHLSGILSLDLINADQPIDRVRVCVVGEAKDNSDKVYNKLYTSAIKNFYKIEYNVAEGSKDDTDAIQSDDDLEASVTTKEQVNAKRNDPFFGKPCTPAKAEKTAPVKTDADIEGEKAAERARARVAVPLDRNKVISAIVLAKLDKTNKEKVDSYLASRHCAKVADCTDAQLRDLIDDLGLKVGS